MNPFDWHGPPFLVFYAALCAVVTGLVVLALRALESGDVPRLRQVDPYLVACLRGGVDEALRAVVLSLFDRKLLALDGVSLSAQQTSLGLVRRPIEREVLSKFIVPGFAQEILSFEPARQAAQALVGELERMRLVRGRWDLGRRVGLGIAAIATLWGVATAKIVIALGRGRTNIEFLVIFALIAVPFVVVRLWGGRTALGDQLLADLRQLFSGLGVRSHEVQLGGATNELALLVGVFGLYALSGEAESTARLFFPAPITPPGAGGGDSSGGGSSCGSSCGGGCGGGGCGGCGG